jgi:hypothetical protein
MLPAENGMLYHYGARGDNGRLGLEPWKILVRGNALLLSGDKVHNGVAVLASAVPVIPAERERLIGEPGPDLCLLSSEPWKQTGYGRVSGINMQ